MNSHQIQEIQNEIQLSVIVPIYNEKNLEQKLIKLMRELAQDWADFEVVAVSDGSTNLLEETTLKLNHLEQNLQLIHYNKNKGKGYAIREGFKHAKGTLIAFLDGGMELSPKQLKDFQKIMHKHSADGVVGSKRHSDSKIHNPLLRRILSRIYQFFIRLFFKLHIKDTQTGIKLYKRSLLENIIPKTKIDRFAFDLELLYWAQRGKFKIVEAPVHLEFFKDRPRHRPVRDIAHTLKVGLPLLAETIVFFIQKDRWQMQKKSKQDTISNENTQK